MAEIEIQTREDLKTFLSETCYDTTIIKLTATWCGPCKKIAPFVDSLNKHYASRYKFQYIEIDVDNAMDLYAFFKKMKMANGIPTFLTFKKEMYTPETFYIPYKCVTGASTQGLQDFYKASFTC